MPRINVDRTKIEFGIQKKITEKFPCKNYMLGFFVVEIQTQTTVQMQPGKRSASKQFFCVSKILIFGNLIKTTRCSTKSG
jgi:hypothetical protein